MKEGLMHRLLLGLLLVFAAAHVHAQETDRLRLEAVIDAPVDAVWDAYTTKAGLESWMVPHADVDLKVGGKFRTHFEPTGKIGDDQTIEHTILSFEPKRMLSLKMLKTPAGFPFERSFSQLWSIVYFMPEGGKTRVTEVTMGFDQSLESQQLKQFLNEGNRT